MKDFLQSIGSFFSNQKEKTELPEKSTFHTKCTGPILSYGSLPFLSIYFVDVKTGWVVGGLGKILYTHNGGITWKEQHSGPAGLYLMAVHFADRKRGWAAGRGNIILYTNNGGEKWSLQHGIPPVSLEKTHYEEKGWVSGYGETKRNIPPLPAIEGIYFSDSVNGWAVGSSGKIFATVDGGLSWTTLDSETDVTLFDVHFVNPERGWITGSRGTILSSRYGIQNTGTEEPLFSIYFCNLENGWAAGGKGTILKSIDRGQAWKSQNSGTGEDLYSIYFINSETGWAAGSGGIIINTGNGGKKWSQQKSNTGETLYSIFFVDINNGWAAGNNGTILNTRDGGRKWTSLDSNTESFFLGVNIEPRKFWKKLIDLKMISSENSFEEIEEKIFDYEKEIQKNPENTEILNKLVKLYEIRGMIAKTINTYLKIGNIDFNTFELKTAIHSFSRVTQLDPENIKAREKLVEIYTLLNDKKKGLEECLSLSRLFGMKGQSDRAREYLEKGIQIDPHNPNALMELALIKVKKNRIKEGIELYKKIAVSFREKGKLLKAVETYKRITVLQPDDSESHITLGRIYKELEKLSEARESFQNILKYDSHNIEAMSELSMVCKETGEIDTALMICKKILAINPSGIEIHKELGELYEIRGQFNEAVKEYFISAEGYIKNRDYKKASEICRVILELNPAHKETIKMTEVLISKIPQEKIEKDAEATKIPHSPVKKDFILPARSYKDREITEGIMLIKGRTDLSLSLKYTEVEVKIKGMIAEILVTQKFQNEFQENIEAIYIFPLPEDSLVTSLEIKTEKRLIFTEVKEKKSAGYDKKGETSAPLIISPGMIEQGEEILVSLKYSEIIKYRNGEYEFIFPMRSLSGQSETGNGSSVSAPLPSGKERPVSIFISLDADFEIDEVTSPSHILDIQEKGPEKREIRLAKKGEPLNKDFILKYSSQGEKPERSLFFFRKHDNPGVFIFHITPKADWRPEEMIKREIIFVIDRSGSMAGSPINQAKNSLKASLRTLREGDIFSIITFDDRIEYLSEKSLEFNKENLYLADNYINTISARGFTDILGAMGKALGMPVKEEYLRQIVFLTDGAVSNEEKVIEEIQKILGNARIFTFGIGNAVNRYLLDKMAEMGRGKVEYLSLNENIEEAIQKFANQASFPVLTDISLEGDDTSHIYPAPVPDLYFGEILCITGLFHSSGRSNLRLKGKTRGGEFIEELEVNFPLEREEISALETIWAKTHIEHLLKREKDMPSEKQQIRQEIISTSMKYHIISPWTSPVVMEKRGGERKIPLHIPSIWPERQEPELPVTSERPALNIKSPLMSLPFPSSARESPLRPGFRAEGALSSGHSNSVTGVKTYTDSFSKSMKDKTAGPGEEDIIRELTLRWLIRNQNADGCWSDETNQEKRIISTSLALLAFIGHGHTDKRGNYKPHLSKAIFYIKNNMDKLWGTSFALSCSVFFEIYRISPGKKEKWDALEALERLKYRMEDFKTDMEHFFALFAAERAIKAGIAGKKDFQESDRWPEKKNTVDILNITTLEDLLLLLMAYLSGKEETLNSLENYRIKTGDEAGSIKIGNLTSLDSTAIGAFMLSGEGR